MENINDSIEEAVVAEEATEAPVETEAEVVVEESPAILEPVVEEKPKAEKKTKPVSNTETVALFAKNNVAWQGFGSLKAGYNIVSKEDSEKWLTVKNVRIATPEEIAAKVAN